MQVDSGQLPEGTYDWVSMTTPLSFFLFFFKKYYLNSVSPFADYQGWNPSSAAAY